MENSKPSSTLRAIAKLDDQWLKHTEYSAFIGEAYARLLADHPNLPTEVTQGGEHAARQLRQQSQQIGEQLIELRLLVAKTIKAERQPTDQG